MNIRFIAEERLKKTASIVVAGTICLTSVVGLTGCKSSENCSDDYDVVLEGTPLEEARIVEIENNEKIIARSTLLGYKDIITGTEYFSLERWVDGESILPYLTEEEMTKAEMTDEDIIKIYMRINSEEEKEEKDTSLGPKTRVIA